MEGKWHRSKKNRREKVKRRKSIDPDLKGSERRSVSDRRDGKDRRL
ncbi:MAG: hypothetical protein AABY49_11395 [Planctomycetota bacterium]